MKVLLTTINSKYIHQNLAIRLLFELNKGFEGLKIQEFSLKSSIEEVAVYCSEFDVAAFSCYIWNIAKTLDAAKAIKQINPHCKILLGGPEVSYDWKEIIALPEVDFIIQDEGEIPFTVFLSTFPNMDQVPGLVWKMPDGQIRSNAPMIFDLELYKNINPYQSIPDDELQHKICYIEASRGCPNRCEFCLAGLQNRLRYIPQKALKDNLLYLMDRAKTIKFLDRTFNTHPDFAIEVFQFILNNYKPGNIFQFEIKADTRQPEFVEFIQKHVPKGLFRFEIGIQTLNAESNKEVNRRQNFDNIKWFIDQVGESVEIHLDLIVGLPYDYFEDIKFSFEEVFKLFAPELQLGFLKFLKGTPIRQNADKHHYRFDARPPYQIIDSQYLSQNELTEFQLVEHALDVYWNKKRTLNTLRYVALNYSIFDFLRGLANYRNQLTVKESKGLMAVYTSIFDFAVQTYPGDTVLKELILLDYYLQYKIKPPVSFLPEVDKTARKQIVDRLKLNHHKYRYVIHLVHFSVKKLVRSSQVESADDVLIIEFSGVEKPKIIL